MTLLLPLTLPCSAARLPRHRSHRLSAAPGSAACLPCRRPHCPSTALALHQGSRAGSTQQGPGRVDPVSDTACSGLLASPRACLAATRTASAPHQRRTKDLGPDRRGTACMGSRSLTPLHTRLAAARTALAPHQRRIRDHGPARLSTARTGSILLRTPLSRASLLHCTPALPPPAPP